MENETNPYKLIEMQEKRQKELSEQRKKEAEDDKTQFDRAGSIEQALIEAIDNIIIVQINKFAADNQINLEPKKPLFDMDQIDFSEFYI